METKNIKDIEITEQMYIRAIEVEKAYCKLENCAGTDKEDEAFKKWNDLTIAFEEECTDKFEAYEIIREYERRKE